MADLGAHVSEQGIKTIEERPHVGNRVTAEGLLLTALVAQLRALHRYDWNGDPDEKGRVMLAADVLAVLDQAYGA